MSHAVAIFGTMLLVCVAVAANVSSRTTANLRPTTEIGIRHSGPLTMTLSVGEGKETGMAEISQNSPGNISLELPDTWKLREVRGGQLSQITNETGAPGSIKWLLPPTLILSFTTPSSLGTIRLQHTSSGSLELHTARINLLTNKTQEETYLIQAPSFTLP